MLALTLAQPVASAITHGGKRLENRTWRPLRDTPFTVAVHAGSRWWNGLRAPGRPKTTTRLESDVASFCAERWWGRYAAEPVRRRPTPAELAELPTRCLLGVMQVRDVVPVGDVTDDPWALGPWCWRIGWVATFAEPVPCPLGALGLWPLPGELARRCEALVDGISERVAS